MSALDTYLKQYYLAKDAFAKHCGVPTQRLDDLIEKRAVPRATYIVEGDRIFSLAFGSIQTERSRPGEYFHPAQKRWVALAHGAPPESEAKTVQETFFSELRSELAYHNGQTLRLSDAFDDDGNEIPSGLNQRLENYWKHFLYGTFGLCVSDPSNGRNIADKEIYQEKLTLITENGQNPSPTGIGKTELLALVDKYARTSMPFSPAEYERSSRKRLVDDLRVKVSKF